MAKVKKKDGSKNLGGRPTKWTEKQLLKIGNDLIDWLNQEPKNELAPPNIWFQEYLNSINLYKHFVTQYTNPKNEASYSEGFSSLIKSAKSIQEFKLWKYASLNALNPAISIFALKNHHGAVDKTEQDNTLTADVKVTKRLLDPDG